MSQEKPRIVLGQPSAPRRPPVLAAYGLLGALVGGLVGWFSAAPRVVDTGVSSSAFARLQASSDQLNQRVAVAERARQVSDNAMAALKQTLFDMDQQLASQREEVSFYRRLLDAGGSVQGLAVHEFQLAPTSSPRVFSYRLVLTQNLKKTRRVDGTVRLSVNGITDHRAVQLKAADLGQVPAEQAFEFKYYQLLAGTLSLPEGFAPAEVVVRAEVDNSSRSAQQAFPWQAAMSEVPESPAAEVPAP